MITILSPSKTMDFSNDFDKEKHSQPEFTKEVKTLVEELKKKSRKQLSDLMDVSEQLADLNYDRFQNFKQKHMPGNSKQALLAYRGDVYNGIDIEDYDADDFDFAQNHLRILSGLYGVLRPLDLIQPYRLEMSTKLKNPEGKDLYKFWGNKLKKFIQYEVENQRSKILLNLASNEYFKAIKDKKLKPYLLNVDFKEYREGTYKTIAIYAKMARGQMANFIVRNRIDNKEHLKAFDIENYNFNEKLSDDSNFVFTR